MLVYHIRTQSSTWIRVFLVFPLTPQRCTANAKRIGEDAALVRGCLLMAGRAAKHRTFPDKKAVQCVLTCL